jgi:beta-phosphoglucomutase
MKPNAVVYDLDGTIVDTEKFHLQAWELTSGEFSLGISGERIHRASLGISSEKTLTALFPSLEPRHRSAIASRKFRTMLRLMEDEEVELMPGFYAIWEKLRSAGMPVGICTSARKENVLALTKTKGLLSEILKNLEGRVVWKESCARGKPFPDPLLETLRRVGSPHPSSVVYVGDAHADFLCAHAAGTQYLHFTTPNTPPPPHLPPSVRVITDHRESEKTFCPPAVPNHPLPRIKAGDLHHPPPHENNVV